MTTNARLALAAIALPALLTACGGGAPTAATPPPAPAPSASATSPGAPPSATATETASPSASARPTTSSTPTRTPSPTRKPSGTPAPDSGSCNEKSVKVTVGRPDSGMSKTTYPLTITNTSDRTCILDGAPTVYAQDENNENIATGVSPDAPGTELELPPGKTGTSSITITNAEVIDNCRKDQAERLIVRVSRTDTKHTEILRDFAVCLDGKSNIRVAAYDRK
ncbi:DUF4232 domain-containing protein [Mariniluteicoccus flavus]